MNKTFTDSSANKRFDKSDHLYGHGPSGEGDESAVLHDHPVGWRSPAAGTGGIPHAPSRAQRQGRFVGIRLTLQKICALLRREFAGIRTFDWQITRAPPFDRRSEDTGHGFWKD